MWGDIQGALIRLLLLIDSVIYGFVAKLFALFVDLSEFEFFSDSVIQQITDRFYVVIGVVGLFIVVYNLLLNVINPDSALKGKNSAVNVIFNLTTSLIIIILIPTIFSFAYKVQNVILKDNLIGTLFLGTFDNAEYIELQLENGNKQKLDNDFLVKQYGAQMSWNVLSAFIYTEDEAKTWEWDISKYDNAYATASTVSFWACSGALVLTIGSAVATYFSAGIASSTIPTSVGVAAVACGAGGAATIVTGVGTMVDVKNTSYELIRGFAYNGNFKVITDFEEPIRSGWIEYTPIISTIVGIVLLYMIFSFCLDLGVRAVKLAFYQMLAPIPILLRVLPNGSKIFNNWVKVTFTTFMELFIRMMVLFIVVFFASNISEINFEGSTIARAIIIIGLVTFARQLPKLLADITGIDSGNMKIGIMEKLGAGGALAAGALIGGGFTAGVRNVTNSWRNSKGQSLGKRIAAAAGSGIGGAASGGFRSAKGAGFKAKSWGDMKNAASGGASVAHKKSQDRQAYKASHPGFGGVIKGHAVDAWSGIKDWAGIDAFADLKEEKAVTDEMTGFYKKMSDYVKDDSTVAMYNAEYDAALKNDKTFDSARYQDDLNYKIQSYMSDPKYANVDQATLADMARREIKESDYTRKMTAVEKEEAIRRAAALKKIATVKAINKKLEAEDGRIKDSRFAVIANEMETFKRKNAKYDYVDNMKLLEQEAWDSSYDDIITNGSLDDIENLAKELTGKNSSFGFAKNNANAKKASGDVQVKLAQRIEKEKQKESK